jgi:hypothetical protein
MLYCESFGKKRKRGIEAQRRVAKGVSFHILTIIGPTVISLWLLVMGRLLLRIAAHPAQSA